jgi:hypothetical protein
VNWNLAVPIVTPGPPGSWDDTRHQAGDIVFDGSTYHLFLVGGQTALSIDGSWAVGHWTSATVEGPWIEDPGNPVMSPTPSAWDSFTIYNMAVLYEGGVFKMWYGATSSYYGVVSVGYATSPDGSIWTKHASNPLASLDPGLPGAFNDWGMTPTAIIKEGSTYRLWYTGFEHNGGAIDIWKIGTAISSDGLVWTKEPDPVLEPTEVWEDTKVYYPAVVRVGDGYGMLYSGITWSSGLAYVGYAFSPDGVHWCKWPGNPVLQPLAGCNAFDAFTVIRSGDTFYGWGAHCYEIRFGTAPFEVLHFDGLESGDTTIWGVTTP